MMKSSSTRLGTSSSPASLLKANVRPPAARKCTNAPPRNSKRTRWGADGILMAALFVCGYPPVNFRFQHLERYGAVLEHLVVERRDLEFRAQRLFGALAQFDDLELSDLVRQRLAGNGREALGLGHRARHLRRGVRHHVVDGLLAGPSLE